MSLFGIMGTSASGMAAQSDRLGTVADNIANVNTTGYKRASVEFSTLVPLSTPLQYETGSVESHARRAVSEQGAFAYSRSTTDLAVNGNGFFVVRGPQGLVGLTRAGSFVADSEGELRNAAGYKLLAYPVQNGEAAVTVNGAAGLEPVSLQDLSMRAKASTAGTLRANLPSAGDVVAAGVRPSDNVSGSSYTARTSLVGYDHLGAEVTFDIYFAKTAPHEWQVTVFDRAAAASNGGFPYASGPLSQQSLTFDPSTGSLDVASPNAVTFNVPGGAAVTLDLSATTQLAGNFSVQSASIDGNAPVSLDRVEISQSGLIVAVYENGARIPSYRIPLGRVPSPDNMTPLAGNVFLPSLNSGDLLISEAGSGGAGLIASGALELSSVDLAQELTAMIEAQRSYTANSRVFQTGADLMDVIVSLRR